VVGGRVLVPFRQQRLTGIVVELHDRKPSVAIKPILSVLDSTPVLDQQLLSLGRWIADYYLAPLGEVFRTMLPLNAEFKRGVAYRITKAGQMALHAAGVSGYSARSRRAPEEQAAEYRVLDYLSAQQCATGEAIHVREETVRSATRVSKTILSAMVRKKWLLCEDLRGPRRHSHRQIRTAEICRRKIKRQSKNTHRCADRVGRPSRRRNIASVRNSANNLEHTGQARSDRAR
jgi:primosomal protein N' (replication factor Y)